MQLTIAELPDLIQIARDTYDLWSDGLRKDFYRQRFRGSCDHTWAKRHIYRLCLKERERVIASCKVIDLPLIVRGRYCKILGLGAVFTPSAHRGQGLATHLVKSTITLAKQQNYDAVLLYSAIDPHFYARCGFVPLGNLDFEIHADTYSPGKYNELPDTLFESHELNAAPWLARDEIDEILWCHNRWLRRQPYGIVRDCNYFAFQMARWLYKTTYSQTEQPKPCLTLLRHSNKLAGYAVCENSSQSLRILEVVGNESARALLWRDLISQAKNMGLKRISGFESVVRDFVPRQRLEHDLIGLEPAVRASHIRCYERFWAQPMFLPINRQLAGLSDHNPCPLLEFDYF